MQSRECPGSHHEHTQPHSQALLLIAVLISSAGCLLSPCRMQELQSGKENQHPVVGAAVVTSVTCFGTLR